MADQQNAKTAKAKKKREHKSGKGASQAIRSYLACRMIQEQINWSTAPNKSNFKTIAQQEIRDLVINDWDNLGHRLWGEPRKGKPRDSTVRKAFGVSSVAKHLNAIEATDKLCVSPFKTSFHHMYFVEIQINNSELREMIEEAKADEEKIQSTEDAGKPSLTKKPHEHILCMLIETIDKAVFEDAEDGGRPRPYSQHIAISNAYVVHGKDRVLNLLVYTDDGMYTLGHLVRDVLLVTKPVADVRTFVVGYNHAYKGYSGDTPAVTHRI